MKNYTKCNFINKQLGESEWQRLSELERQKKMMELKLKERQLRREGKFDEISQILGIPLCFESILNTGTCTIFIATN